MRNPLNRTAGQIRPGLLLTVWICWLGVSAQAVRATTYYVDAAGGADRNPGTTSSAPWKTLGKVSSFTFAPGDQILLAAGNRWEGKLNPKGSGTAGKPIIIDRYGDGAKPIIDGAGATGDGVVYLRNQQYWEIANLEITNDAATGGDRRGVMVAAA
ncbi:MAG: right-handed parallel beta-helix repeat-containing protein, partial [Planctomycetota bacterium]